MSSRRTFIWITRAATVACALVMVAGLAVAKKPSGGGRLSPASLDLDTCGCPTTFGDLADCSKTTAWDIAKSTDTDNLFNPDNEAFSFTVTVTEGPTSGRELSIAGARGVTNSGGQPTYLSSLAILLEDQDPGAGNAPGPSGDNWSVVAAAAVSRDTLCGESAVTCDGLFDTFGGTFELFTDETRNHPLALSGEWEIPVALDDDNDGMSGEDPVLQDTLEAGSNCWGIFDNDMDGLADEDPGFGVEEGIDNDGDGQIDEDPVDGIDNDLDGLIDEDDPDDDGDGLVDEDGPDDDRDGQIDEDSNCGQDDVVVFYFTATFDLDWILENTGYTEADLVGPGDGVVPSPDDLRFDLLATFKAGDLRGGTCAADVDCDGVLEDGKRGNADEGEGDVRTVQQRKQFDPIPCPVYCQEVTVTDLMEWSEDCVDLDVEVNDLAAPDVLVATGGEGTTTTYEISGTVNCACPDPLDLAEDALEPYNDDGSGSASLVVAYPGGATNSYFTSTLSGTSEYDGVYSGWCVDADNTISPGTTYCVELVSSYAGFAEALVDNPEHLDEVNWVINQGYVGTPSNCGGNFTWGDVQGAIWSLVEDSWSGATLGSYSQCRIDEIVATALASGDGFEPTCSQYVSVVANPCGNTGSGPQAGVAQITMMQIPMETLVEDCGDCPGCGTLVTNTATLTGDGCEGLITGSPATASFNVTCGDLFPGVLPGDFCSQTQGGWGTDACNGNNTACLREAYFAELFPAGLVVGDADGPDNDGLYAIYLGTSDDVAAYLPAGGTPSALTADQTNPVGSTSSGIFGGQLVAATLNVAYDLAGHGKSDPERTPPPYLGDLVFVDGCVATELVDVSVNQVIAWSNCAISGEDLAVCGVPAGVEYSQLSDALATVNEAFVDCENSTGCLATSTVTPVTLCADFSGFTVGTSVEGAGTVLEGLTIDADGATGDAQAVFVGARRPVGDGYGAPNADPTYNGCLAEDGGFTDMTKTHDSTASGRHAYTFTFDDPVSEFSLRMMDYGDWNPSKSGSIGNGNARWVVTMTAHAADDTIVDSEGMDYITELAELPKLGDLGNPYIVGDACTSTPGQPGNYTWTVSGSGITRVELDFSTYAFDNRIAFDTLCYTTE